MIKKKKSAPLEAPPVFASDALVDPLLPPLPKNELIWRLGYEFMSESAQYENLAMFLGDYKLMLYRDTHLWTCELRGMPESLRKKLDTPRPRPGPNVSTDRVVRKKTKPE